MKITGDEPYFPVIERKQNDGEYRSRYELFETGITIKHQLAAMAMNALLSNSWYTKIQDEQMLRKDGDQKVDEMVASRAMEIANAMIKEFNKT